MSETSPSTSAPASGARKPSLMQRVLPFLITAACFAYLYNRLNHAAAAEGSGLAAYIARSFENVRWDY